MIISELLLLLLLLVSSTNAKCNICSFFHDYYDGSSEQRLEDRVNSKPRTYSADPMDQALVTSLARVSELASSLFGSLGELTNRRNSQISSDDVPAPLRTKVTAPKLSSKMEQGSSQEITNHLFNIFDKIGSGIIRISRLDGPHICTREITRKIPSSNKTSRKSEKICQRFRDASKCIDRRTHAKGLVETTRVEECCEGYETRDIFEYGCPIESPVRTMNEVLERVNSSLWQLAKNGGVEDELGRSNITVFASSGNDNPPDDARSYVINRIVQGIHRAYDWTDETVLKTTGGGDLVISQSEDVFGSVRTFVNCVPLNSSGHRAQNGIVHVVDGDLRPADDTLLSTLEKDHRFSSFSKLLSDKLPKLLPENKNFTVFVPSEEVFSSLSDSLLKDIKAGQGCTSSFAPSHIVEGSICSSELSHHRLKSVAGSEIDVRTRIRDGKGVTYVGRARLVGGDIYTRNGVVHIIDDLLVNDEFLSWKEHLRIYNPHLSDALSDVENDTVKPITIFVPPPNNKSQISHEMARNHIVSGEVLEDFRRSSTIETDAKSEMFTGYSPRTSPIWVRFSMGSFQRQLGQLGCTRIIRDSVRGCRSILHFIEKPLPLITDNFDTFLGKRKDLSKFYSLWKKSTVNGSLTTNEPITVFIPSDDAFSNNEFKKLLDNSKLSDIFVKRYIVSEPLCEFDIHPHPAEIRIQTHANLNGEPLRLRKFGDDTFIDGARIEESEIVLSNGVAYVVDSTIFRKQFSTQPDISQRADGLNFLNIIS